LKINNDVANIDDPIGGLLIMGILDRLYQRDVLSDHNRGINFPSSEKYLLINFKYLIIMKFTRFK
jgi:hypothetical protein